MIKINLANSLIAKSGATQITTTSMSQVSVAKWALNGALILFPVIGMVIFEKNSLGEKTKQLEKITAEQTTLTKELASVGSVDDIVRQVTEQRKDLDEKFNVMRQIFGLRSQKIQSLFAVQASVPGNSWLTRVMLEEKSLILSGFAASIEDAQTLVSSLAQEKNLFSNVNMTNVITENMNGTDYFKFDIMVKLKD